MKTIIIDGVEYDLTPKALFKKGDWIVYCNEDIDIITGIEDSGYLINEGGYIPFTCQGNMRLWTIQDAKDGDVLTTKDAVFIFKHMDVSGLSLCKSHCDVIDNSGLGLGFDFPIQTVHPATEEQRDKLEKAITAAGYKWDAEKKELKKIEQKSIWGEEDEKGLGDALWAIKKASTTAKDENEMGNLWYAEKWLKSLKERMKGE